MTDESPSAAVASSGRELPTGVVTFLFSDIQGSTRMLEEHRAVAGVAFARHHELVQDAIEERSWTSRRRSCGLKKTARAE